MPRMRVSLTPYMPTPPVSRGRRPTPIQTVLPRDGWLEDADHTDALRVARLRVLHLDPDDAGPARLDGDADLAVLAGDDRLVDAGPGNPTRHSGCALPRRAFGHPDRDRLGLAVALEHLRRHNHRVADLGL